MTFQNEPVIIPAHSHWKTYMNQPQLIVMVGLPGSGKDYWIEQFIKQNGDQKWHVASSDAIIEAIAAEQGKTYSEVFDSTAKHAMKRMESEVSEAIKRRENIIWNQTNMAPGKRKSILSKFPAEYHKKAVVVTTDPEVHHRRLKNRADSTGKSIPSHVIRSMRDNYVEPTRDEGFDDIIHIDNT